MAKPWELLVARNFQAKYDEQLFLDVMSKYMLVNLRPPEEAPGCRPGTPLIEGARTLYYALGGMKHDADKLKFAEHYIETAKRLPAQRAPM
jgi:hypothetical protein